MIKLNSFVIMLLLSIPTPLLAQSTTDGGKRACQSFLKKILKIIPYIMLNYAISTYLNLTFILSGTLMMMETKMHDNALLVMAEFASHQFLHHGNANFTCYLSLYKHIDRMLLYVDACQPCESQSRLVRVISPHRVWIP